MITLRIRPQQPIESIQGQFNKAFPNLKIECFKHPHAGGKSGTKKSMLAPATLLSECMNSSKEITVSFAASATVRQLEELLKREAGINVQVFRKSGKVWLVTTATDGWTLQQQDEEGKKSVSETKEEIESADDHDIY